MTIAANVHSALFSKVMETETITVLKLLKRYGVRVRIPVTARIGYEETVFNFPTFVCVNYETATKVQQAIYHLCIAWNSNNDDRLISYSIVVNEGDDAKMLTSTTSPDLNVNFMNSFQTNCACLPRAVSKRVCDFLV